MNEKALTADVQLSCDVLDAHDRVELNLHDVYVLLTPGSPSRVGLFDE